MKKGLIVLMLVAVTAAYAGSIEGLVIDSLSREPIAGALVQAAGLDSIAGYGEAYTDSSGFYTIDGLGNGRYQVDAGKAGYLPKTYPGVVFVTDTSSTGINFELIPLDTLSGSISGVVADSLTGMPIAGAKVFSMAGFYWEDTTVTYTDTSGFYKISNLDAGSYMVQAERLGYYSALYPDQVMVYEGQNTPGINFLLLPKDTIPSGVGAISGIVYDTLTGAPIMNARVYAVNEDTTVYRDSTGDTLYLVEFEAYTDSSGFYKIDSLDAGFYQVSAEHQDYYPATYPYPVEVIDGEETENVHFGLFPYDTTEGGSISGMVFDAYTGYPVMGALVIAEYPDSTGDTLWMNDTLRNGGQAYTDSLGYYFIEGLDAGYYRVSAQHGGYYPSTFPELVEVLEGEETTDIDFTLIPREGDSCWISGRVTFNDSSCFAPGLAIAFAPRGQILGVGEFILCRDSVPRDSLNGDTLIGELYAKYLIPDIPPTECYVLGLAIGYLPQFFDHAYTIEDAVLVQPTATGIDFAFDPIFPWRTSFAPLTGGVSGTIRGKIGPLPISSIYAKQDGEIVAGCAGSETGSYYLSLYPGQYSIYATRPGYKTDQYLGEVTVADQEITNIDISLAPGSQSGEEELKLPASAIALNVQVTPNPFTERAFIQYSIPQAGNVSVKVYDISGSMVRKLSVGPQAAGIHELSWDGRDDNGLLLSAGVYFCRLEFGSYSASKSMIWVR